MSRAGALRLVVVGCVVAVTAAAATGPVGLPPPSPAPINLPPSQVSALSGLDVALQGDPAKEAIEDAFGAQPLTELIRVARGQVDEDKGVRIRAYRAIGLYQTPQARVALIQDLEGLAQTESGPDILILRAAIDALGNQREPNDVAVIVPFLDFEASRDVRAAAADALRIIGSSTAKVPLQYRQGNETVEQVKHAIRRALTSLDELTPP